MQIVPCNFPSNTPNEDSKVGRREYKHSYWITRKIPFLLSYLFVVFAGFQQGDIEEKARSLQEAKVNDVGRHCQLLAAL